MPENARGQRKSARRWYFKPAEHTFALFVRDIQETQDTHVACGNVGYSRARVAGNTPRRRRPHADLQVDPAIFLEAAAQDGRTPMHARADVRTS